MQKSRRELYALGEPFGTSCTQQKPGGPGRIYGGGGGGSSSSSTNQTFNTDKRLITGENSFGASLDDSLLFFAPKRTTNTTLTDSRNFSSADTTNITTIDGGAIAAGATTAIESMKTAGKSITDALGFATSANSGAMNFASNANSGALNFVSNAANNAFDLVNDSSSNALAFGESALNTVELNNATLGDGFSRLLDAADNLFERGESLIGQTGDRIADAYSTATVEKSGSIDNKTITVLAVAGAVALIALNARK